MGRPAVRKAAAFGAIPNYTTTTLEVCNRPEEEFSHQNSSSSQPGGLGAEQQLSSSFHEWPFWQVGGGGGGGVVGRQQDLSVRRGKVSPGEVMTA